MSDLITCYRYHQKTQGVLQSYTTPGRERKDMGRAARSLVLARADVAAGTSRYTPAGSNYGPKFEALGESHMRWMENPEAAGLRLVGFADELSRHIDHTGWFTDRDFQDETARGIVYRLPARNGDSVFVYGYADPCNDGPACLCFDITGDKLEAACWADGIAELMAEQESEYQEAWRAGRSYEEAEESIGVVRRATLTLIKEIKALCPSPKTYPKTHATLRGAVTSALAEIRTLREQRADWFDSYGGHCGFTE